MLKGATRISLLALIAFMLVVQSASGVRINDRLEMDLSERFRFKGWDNAVTLDEAAEGANAFTRNRTSLGLKWTPDELLQTYVKFTNEFRHYFFPENREFTFHEIVFDQLYIKLIKPSDIPLTLTLGRQNITLGEGFIMYDGGPADGSRTAYFNAVRADWNINDHNQLTAFYSRQPKRDDYLPVIHCQRTLLVEQPEEGLGLYYTGDRKNINLQAYFIRKNADSTDAIPVNSNVNMPGARVKWVATGQLNCVAEAAAQFGKIGENDRKAFGGYAYCEYKPAWKCPARFLPYSLKAGVIYLGGDDHDTDDWEGWDPMFGRWPKWCESHIYTRINEDRISYWTNLKSLYIWTSFKPDSNIGLDMYYYRLGAVSASNEDDDFPGGTGKTRGDLFGGKFTYVINDRWAGHFVWEGFIPGNYYFENADGYSWLRTELSFKM